MGSEGGSQIWEFSRYETWASGKGTEGKSLHEEGWLEEDFREGLESSSNKS